MLNLIIFILISLSITNILINESIFSGLRNLLFNKFPKIYNFIICPVCLSWHIGWILSFVFSMYGGFIINLLVCAFISSIANKIFVLLIPEKFNLE